MNCKHEMILIHFPGTHYAPVYWCKKCLAPWSNMWVKR